MDEKIIYLRSVNEYGCNRLYPVGKFANLIKTLTEKKTLNQEKIKALQKMGFSFKMAEDMQPKIEDIITENNN